ncbi:MAG: alpha/beta hydrolase [Rhodospirillaceae bacterium]|nr:MAG: alpha/beta hydrolase [Rhodospirillaceae bacterium]
MSAGARLPGTPDPMHVWPGCGGVAISGDVWGDPHGPLVMLQHGGGQTRHAWKSLGETLGQAGYRAVAFDARGHGDSQWAPSGIYGANDMVDDLCCVAKALGSDHPILVGASMGGSTSLVAVGENRLAASALVLVDTAPQIEPGGARHIQEFMTQKPDGFDSLEEVAEAIANYQPHRKRPRNLDGLVKNVRLAENGKYRWHWDPAFLMGRGGSLEEHVKRLHDCGNNLKLPTLLVRGGLSDVLSEEGARRFLEQCPHAEYVSVADAAHMVAGDRNDIFADAVIEFLMRVVPATGGKSSR